MNNTRETKQESSIETSNAGSIQAIRNERGQFVKGVSGNPSGKPLNQRNFSTIYREALLKLAELNKKDPDDFETEIIMQGVGMARKGDYKFWQDIIDRIHGKPKQPVEHGGAITISHVLKELAEANERERAALEGVAASESLQDQGQATETGNVQAEQIAEGFRIEGAQPEPDTQK